MTLQKKLLSFIVIRLQNLHYLYILWNPYDEYICSPFHMNIHTNGKVSSTQKFRVIIHPIDYHILLVDLH